MEEALELENYLPVSFKSPKEQEYISFLWDAFETNYSNEKFQFAFLAYHMLTMSFVYFNIWQIKLNKTNDFEKALIGFNKDVEKELISATTPFTFWRVNESSVLRFLKLIGCDNSKVGTYAVLVKERNDTAHTNGNIFFSTKEALDDKIKNILRIAEDIQEHSKPVILDCYRDFLISSSDPEERQFYDPLDQIREILIHENYLSPRDIEFCLSFDTHSLSDHQGFEEILDLHKVLLKEYKFDNEGK